jgi:SAM-dependent methyltransferase
MGPPHHIVGLMAEGDGGSGATSVPCPSCANRAGEELLILPPIPVHVGLLWRSGDEARACPKADFTLALCAHCGYVWNTAFDPTQLDYSRDYDNALHFSPKFAAWERGLAEHLVERYDLHGRTVAEIGCGDGRFLAMICTIGDNTGIGFEPGYNPARLSELVDPEYVEIVPEFADAESLRNRRADFVMARHVLEHLPEPTMLVAAMRNGMANGGVYVEVPDLAFALDRGAFEDLMYEHCGYYTPETLAHLLRRHGFADVSAARVFDGLFASVEARIGSAAPNDDPIDPVIVESLRERIGVLADRIASARDELIRRTERGESIVAWGGGARAVGLLNLVRSSAAIDRVVDVNPRKQGTFVTGTGHPIVSPDSLVGAEPDTVVVVNPIYRDEIAAMLSELGIGAQVVTI